MNYLNFDMNEFNWFLGGFFGNRCEITNACVNNPCKNGGACFTTGPGNYNCSCTSQFAGDNCELC